MTSRRSAPLALLIVAALLTAARAAPPVPADERLTVELIAEAPDLVTPTGVAVDAHGDVWVVENHTHQRPNGYKGPETDRVRVFSDFGPDGRAGKVRTFAEGFRDSMSLAFGPDGGLYFATRSTLYRLNDSDKDGKADDPVKLVRLETKGNYPHNGLAGFAFDARGWMYFGLGENLGETFRLVGSDGATLSGGGEGGSVYRCRPDGSKLERIATGFWNPYHQALDAFGRLYIVDNDPDARGPCRLVHVVEGGDYGYRFRYGRKGQHPFVCWNGELPGTLPMASGTAEAPSGVVAYESDGLPPEYRGKLLATSWGDHVVEYFTVSPRGASVEAKGKVLLRGGEDFRPVGVAVAPDGSLVISDWVDKSYPVHGKGRLWRVRARKPQDDGMVPEKVAGLESKDLRKLLAHPKVEVRRAAVAGLLG
jgi:putative membrane-bound dehydrogenase-like protein